jgi:beta propeller repeat protein
MRCRTFAAFVVVLGVAAAGLAAAGPAAATMVTKTEAVTADTLYQDDVATDGSFVVWAQKAGGTWDIWGAAISPDHVVGTPQAICGAAGDPRHPQVAQVAGAELVVWQDGRTGHWDIRGARIDTASFTVTGFTVCAAAGDQTWPKIDGVHVVWQDHRGATWDIYEGTIDPTTLAVAETPLWAYAGDQTRPDISGDRVVYASNALGNGDIYETDVSSPGTQTAVITNKAVQDQPIIDGDLVVWRDFRFAKTNGTDLYAHDFAADTTQRVVMAVADQADPALSGGVLVCTDSRNAFLLSSKTQGTDIMFDDLALSEEGPVSIAKGDQARPAISGNDVFWIDSSVAADHGDVWHAVLSPWSAAVWMVRAGTSSSMVWTNTPVIDLQLYAESTHGAVTQYSADNVGAVGPFPFVPFTPDIDDPTMMTHAGWDLTTGLAPGFEGRRTVEVVFQDDSGLSGVEYSPRVAATVTLDMTPPASRGRTSYGTHGGTASIRYRVDDNLAPRCTATIVVKTRSGATKKTFTLTKVTTGVWHSRTFACALPRGSYVFTVSAVDLARNAGAASGGATLVVK